MPDEFVDLVYLDPPFNSNATYNVLFRENDSSESAAQIQAFDDTWHWNIDSERAYREVVQDGRRGYVGGGCCGWRYGGWLHSWFGIPAFAGMTGGAGQNDGFGRERLDERKASRISVARHGTIDADDETLQAIRDWMVANLLKSKQVFGPRLDDLIEQL